MFYSVAADLYIQKKLGKYKNTYLPICCVYLDSVVKVKYKAPIHLGDGLQIH